jgi:hypothetical protein
MLSIQLPGGRALKNNPVNCFSEWARMQGRDISLKADHQEISRGHSSYWQRAKPKRKRVSWRSHPPQAERTER